MTARRTHGTTRRRSTKPGQLAAGLFGVALMSGLVWLALDAFTGWTPGWAGFAAGVVAGVLGVRPVLLLVFRPFVALNKAMAAPRLPRVVWPHETTHPRKGGRR